MPLLLMACISAMVAASFVDGETCGVCSVRGGALAAGGEVVARVSRLMHPVRPLPTAAVAAICLAAALLVAAPVTLLVV